MNDTTWKNSKYDAIKHPIGGKDGRGCALTCMAMILGHIGFDVTPLSLNNWMEEKKIFDDSGNVKCECNSNLTLAHGKVRDGYNQPVIADESIPDGKNPLHNDPNDDTKRIGTPMSTDEIDTWVNNGYHVIAEVKDVHTNGTESRHFVILTEKEGNTYSIADPNDKQTLDSYGGGSVYETVAYLIYK